MGGGKKDMEGGRKSVNGSYDPSGRKSRIPAAYPVTMLVDLQVYVVPREKWVLSRRLYRHNIVEEGISLGFVRVLPQLSIHNLRRELQLQLGPDVIPRDFIFIRAVGNIFIQLKPKQEIELKVKNFIPPFSVEPEIYLLEVLPNEDPRMISPLPLLLREDTPPHICHDLCHHSLARKIQVIKRDDSPQPTTPFPPVSITPSPTPYNPMTPYSPSPSEYKGILEQYQQDIAGEGSKSRADIVARQAAYDYENEVFESPTPTPSPTVTTANTSTKSSIPRPLVRQKSIHHIESIENEETSDSKSISRNQTTTTESPSSADTVRTAIRIDSENETGDATLDKSLESLSQTGDNVSETQNEESKETEQETESKTQTMHSESIISDRTVSTHSTKETHDEEEITTTHTIISEHQETQKEVETSDKETVVQTASEETIKENLVNTDKEPQETQDAKIDDDIKGKEFENIQKPHETVDGKTSEKENDKVPKIDSSEDTGIETLKEENSSNTQEAMTTTRDQTTHEVIESHSEIISTDTQEVTIRITDDSVTIRVTDDPGKTSQPDPENSSTTEKHEHGESETKHQTNTKVISEEHKSEEKTDIKGNDEFQNHSLPALPPLSAKVPEKFKSKPQTDSTAIVKTNDGENQKTIKPKSFRDPRKPALYPQRMTKTTIARQALAREKRRVYVEERIQSYIKSSQVSGSHSTKPLTQARSHQDIIHESIESGGYERRRLGNGLEKGVGLSHQANFSELSNTRLHKLDPLQSLPDINALNYNYNRNTYSCNKRSPPQTLSAISVIRPPYSYSSSFAMTDANVPGRSHSDITSQATFESESHNGGIYVDSNPEATSNYWKNVSEQGFYYSFRVRQSGTVQMIDRAVQTGEQPQSYLLDFSRKSDGSYYLKSSKPLPQTPDYMHLPPINRDKILRDITETVQLRHDAELRRAELIQRANDLQSLVKEKRDKINRRHEFWHKKYIEESSMTRPLEAACNSLRSELNTVHRRLIAHLEGRDLPLRLRDGPSKKANYKIMAARLQHEIKELQQKAKSAKLRLESEIKLKEQAEREVRDIRNDLAHKKVVMSLARSQIGTLPAAHAHSRGYDTLVY